MIYTVDNYVAAFDVGVTVSLAAQVLRASNVFANCGIGVLHEVVVFRALKVRTDFVWQIVGMNSSNGMVSSQKDSVRRVLP